MDLKVVVVLSVLCMSYYSDARELSTISSVHQKVGKKENICTLCEEFTTSTINYLAANETQTEIIEILHQSCSKLLNFEPECITLVDYYAPLFFLEISSIQPGDFCTKFGLCEQVVLISRLFSKDGCELCHHALSEALIKLKDPDTQLEIIEILLKLCDSAESYAKQCKKLVFEYGPLILVNAEQFLEKNDICTVLHACTATTSAKQSSPGVKVSMHSSS